MVQHYKERTYRKPVFTNSSHELDDAMRGTQEHSPIMVPLHTDIQQCAGGGKMNVYL